MPDVLLIQPPPPTPDRGFATEFRFSSPPLALGYLAAVLLAEGISVDIVDMDTCGLDASGIEDQLRRASPGLVGVSTTTLTYKNALRIAEIVKRVDPGIRVVLGGPHVTFCADDALGHDSVDFVVRGEGEQSLVALAGAVLAGRGSLAEVPGLSFRAPDRRRVHVRRAPLVENLDALPFPARHLLPLDRYLMPGTLITGRGCEGKCVFCAARAIAGGRYRMRSIARVLDEVEMMASIFGLRFFFFADDTFTAFPQRTREFCRSLHERSIEISWMCETRVDTVDRRTLQAMADAGCRMVQFGAESGSQSILAAVQKGSTVEQLRRAVATAVEVGIQPTCSFMVPHAADTRETIGETMDLIRELKAMGAGTGVSLTTPFPGTCLSTHLVGRGGLELICEDTDRYNLATPVIKTHSFDEWEIREIFLDMVLLCLGETGSPSQAATEPS